MLKILYFVFICLKAYIYFMRNCIGYIFYNSYIVDLIIENNLDS